MSVDINQTGTASNIPQEKRVVLACRGVRGAITVTKNETEEMLTATRQLLQRIVEVNQMNPDDVASVYFTTTADLTATYPALAARQIGWLDQALLCGHEMNVPHSLPLCIRVLIHWNTHKTVREIVHVYLGEAASLRPDRKNIPPIAPQQTDPIEAMNPVLENTV